jgi:hypothetical protein
MNPTKIPDSISSLSVEDLRLLRIFFILNTLRYGSLTSLTGIFDCLYTSHNDDLFQAGHYKSIQSFVIFLHNDTWYQLYLFGLNESSYSSCYLTDEDHPITRNNLDSIYMECLSLLKRSKISLHRIDNKISYFLSRINTNLKTYRPSKFFNEIPQPGKLYTNEYYLTKNALILNTELQSNNVLVIEFLNYEEDLTFTKNKIELIRYEEGWAGEII